MNVSPEADAAFMRALTIEDPQRYANLIRNMERAAAKQPDRESNVLCGRKFKTFAERREAKKARDARYRSKTQKIGSIAA